MKTKKQTTTEKKIKVSVLGSLMEPVRYRFLKLRHNLEDDDLLTEKDFKQIKIEMFGDKV